MQTYSSLSEEKVRVHLTGKVASKSGKPTDAFKARLRRTWIVKIIEAELEDDELLFDLFA